jgi:ammonium transporter Rh
MIFIGFGFLMTFLKKYGFSSIGFNFLISCLAIQWALISNNLLHYIATAGTSDAHGFAKIKLGIVDLVKADFAAGAVLITFGAVLGKTSPLQMLAVTFFELIFYGVNEAIGAGRLQVVDMGGSIFVHTFGAYFGLALSYAISRSTYKAGKEDKHFKNGSNKTSDMFAMIGTMFLWMFWPSFNGALATEDQQYRVVINTVIALTASCVIAFVAVIFFSKDAKFDMVSIQNATLAGGVAVGSSSDLVIQPAGALIVGMVAGAISVIGYEKIQPFLSRCMGLDDTCGGESALLLSIYMYIIYIIYSMLLVFLY